MIIRDCEVNKMWLLIRYVGGERQDERELKVIENLGMIGQEIYKIISCFGKDDFVFGGFQIEKLIEYLGGYMRSSIEQNLNIWFLELDILSLVIDLMCLGK